MKTIHYCPRCGSITPAKSQPVGKNFCSKCYTQLHDTYVTPEEWWSFSTEQQDDVINHLKTSIEEKQKPKKEPTYAEKVEEASRRIQRQKQKGNFLMTTGFSFETHKIVSYLGIKSGEIVLGTGFASELSGAFHDLLGTTSNTLTEKLAQAKDMALDKLVDQCIDLGANALIGVDLDICTLGPNMIVACANGTAVKVEPLG